MKSVLIFYLYFPCIEIISIIVMLLVSKYEGMILQIYRTWCAC